MSDGRTTFRTPDSTENRVRSGAHSYASGKVACYPQVRAVSVTDIPTHLVADMAFGQYGQNEMLYAKTLVDRIADHSLTVFDRGFLCAEILLGLSLVGDARHYLISAKSNTKWERIEGTEEDGLVRMRVSPQARSKAPSLPEYCTARHGRFVWCRRTARNVYCPPPSWIDAVSRQSIWPSAIVGAGKSKPAVANSSSPFWARHGPCVANCHKGSNRKFGAP